jgi:hypothetical protein
VLWRPLADSMQVFATSAVGIHGLDVTHQTHALACVSRESGGLTVPDFPSHASFLLGTLHMDPMPGCE